MPKYKIRKPARCPRHYRHGIGRRWAHCPLLAGHKGDHQWPELKNPHAARRRRKFLRRMDRIMEEAGVKAAALQEFAE